MWGFNHCLFLTLICIFSPDLCPWPHHDQNWFRARQFHQDPRGHRACSRKGIPVLPPLWAPYLWSMSWWMTQARKWNILQHHFLLSCIQNQSLSFIDFTLKIFLKSGPFSLPTALVEYVTISLGLLQCSCQQSSSSYLTSLQFIPFTLARLTLVRWKTYSFLLLKCPQWLLFASQKAKPFAIL